ETGVHGLYAALLDSSVRRVIVGSPPASHRQGPTYLGILRYTDIPEVIGLLGSRARLYGEIPPSLRPFTAKTGLDKPLLAGSLAEAMR
ncbi:MAG: hypothetical protein ACREBD_31605, partial [Blastocatellia bacterium]